MMTTLYNHLRMMIALGVIYVLNVLPIKKNKLFFMSYYGSQYGCNPKYITEYILNNEIKSQFDIVWAFNDLESHKDLKGIRKVKTMSIQYFYELCTSKVIITNFRTTHLFRKRKGQYYVQTWHSSLRLKKIEEDAEDVLPMSYIEMAKKDSLKCDLLLSGCDYSTTIFQRAFWYNGPIFKHGTPRNDILIHNKDNLKDRLFERLGLPKDKKVILYAPTFRKDHSLAIYNLDYQSILEKLTDKFGGDWSLLIKRHPHLASQSNQLVHGSNVKDVSSYDDIQELLSITDILITDYSSLMFDFSLTYRPCFLYVPDILEYTSQDRGLYFDIEQLPFSFAKSNAELSDVINEFNNREYLQELTRFQEIVGSYEKGRASESLVNHLLDVCFKENKRGRKVEAA